MGLLFVFAWLWICVSVGCWFWCFGWLFGGFRVCVGHVLGFGFRLLFLICLLITWLLCGCWYFGLVWFDIIGCLRCFGLAVVCLFIL